MTNAEPPADGEGAAIPTPTKPSRRQRRRRQATALRRYLWWGIVAIAILAPASFIVLYFTYHPSAVVRQRTLLVIGGLSVIAWIVIVLWRIPQWQARNAPEPEGGKSRFELENEARQTLGGIVSGLGVVAGLLFTWYQISDSRSATQRSLILTQQGQITERFTRAIDQLGSDAVDVRVGGVYSLERIVQDAPSTYYWPVMEVLASFVREHDTYVAPADGLALKSTSAQSGPVGLDVRAAVIVIGRRPNPPAGDKGTVLNLTGTDLRLLPLKGANLEDADLSGAHLEGANLTGTDLKNANLTQVVTTGLLPATFEGACLKGAKLLGSDITPGQVEVAITDKTTVMRDGTTGTVDEPGCG